MPTLPQIRRYSAQLLKGLLSRSRNYIRLTPCAEGNIRYYDKRNRKCFTVQSRGRIDLVTADHVYVKEDYNFSGLKRFDDIQSIYKEIVNAQAVPLIIDCGGNIGLASRYFAERYPEALVICVEPDQGNIEQAKLNCDGFSSVEFLHAAIGSTEGHARIKNQSADYNAYQIAKSTDQNDVKVVTIPMVEEHAREKASGKVAPFIVKVDIEGYEEDLFASGTEWLQELPLLITELHDWMLPGRAVSAHFLKALAPLGRDFVLRGENVFSIRNAP